tara:strand:- start:354 stop:812 length:459 start_codon:yes stop_codon:yes gene_type:complete
MKKTEKDFNNVLRIFGNPKIPASTRNKVLFKLGALFLYMLMVKANTNKLGNDINRPKQKLSKRSLCIYMAQHTKDFRAFYLNWKAKSYPRNMNKRKELGLNFYHNVICDKRKNWEGPFMYKFLNKHIKTFKIIEGKEAGHRIRRLAKIPKLT